MGLKSRHGNQDYYHTDQGFHLKRRERVFLERLMPSSGRELVLCLRRRIAYNSLCSISYVSQEPIVILILDYSFLIIQRDVEGDKIRCGLPTSS